MTEQLKSRLSQAELDDVIRKHVVFTSGRMGGGRAVLKFENLAGLHFRHANLSGADFTGSDLSGANLSKGNFNGTVFYGCLMTGADLRNGIFTRADLRGADMTDALTEHADLSTADLRQGKVEKRATILEQKLVKQTADLAETPDFVSESFAGTLLSVTAPGDSDDDMRTSDLVLGIEKTAIRNTDFVLRPEEIESRETDFVLTEQEVASRESDLLLTDTDSTVMGGDLDLSTGAHDAAFTSDLDLSIAAPETGKREFVLNGPASAYYASDTDLSQQEDDIIIALRDHARWLSSEGKKGNQLDIRGVDLRGVRQLGRYPLIMVKAAAAIFSGMVFSRSQMQGSDFSNSDFTTASMKDSDLRGSKFTHADFRDADLSRCNFRPLMLKRDRMLTTDLSHADLRGADLSHADLRGVRLDGAKLDGTKLDHALLPENFVRA